MSMRRRIGVNIATSESARRQLMQPVICWEKAWMVPTDVPPGSTLKVYKWVKTDKKQYFSDDEDEEDEPLAPLPDEPETNEVDEEIDQDDPATSVGPDATTSRAVSEPIAPQDELQVDSVLPRPHPLSMSLVPPSPSPMPVDSRDDLNTDSIAELSSLTDEMVPSESLQLEVPPVLLDEDMVSLDMTGLGPDGTQFESVQDLSQIQPSDLILGGEAMDESVDPFNTDT